MEIFTWPSLDFLRESHELIEDPEIQQLRQAVVEINIARREGAGIFPEERRGTGFNICEDGLIVTNRHIVEDADSIIATFPQNGKYGAVEKKISAVADLAVVKIEGEGLPVVPLEKLKAPVPGDIVTIIGNPLGYARVVVRGEVTAYHQRGGISVMEIKAPIHPGSSGSPVFNEEGRVVGVIYAVAGNSVEDDIRGLAVSLSELEELL